MILQALNDYYRRKCDDPDPAQRLPAFGLEQKEIPFLLEITREGKLVQLTDTRTFSGKKKVAQIFRVPLGVKKSSGVVANLLWDTLEYVLGVDTKGKPDRVVAQHAHFVARIKALPQAALEDAGIQAVLAFLADMDLEQLQVQPAWAQAFEVNAVMSFRLHGDVNLVCQRPAVVNAALNVVTDGDERLAMCLVTGNDAPVQRLHAAVKGVWGAQSSGANIVSFNARAFESYGKTERQGENAPVSTAAAFAYTTALNHLLGKGSSHRIQVGDASTVFWADKDSEFESSVPNIFGEPPTDNPDRNAQAVQALFTAMQSGKLAGPGGQTRFHMLGLAPNAARISIRFYHCLPLNELSERILQYFKDLELVRGPNDPQYPSLKRLLQAVCMSTSSQPYGDIDRVPPNLGGAIVDTVFAGSDVPYPSLWLNAAVGRCRAEQAKKTQQGKPVQNVSYLRAAAIKACLNRQIRRSTVTSSNVFQEKEFLPMLDLSNTNPAYRLGRLFAALEKIQEEASPGLNATIRDRYYGAASSTPVAVFTTLLRLKNSHLKKLAVGRAMWFEKLVGEILSAVVDFPKHMPLPDQGRFALGYYHQRQAFFTKNPDASSSTLSSPSTPEGN
jgi:CRISPR-associated protein Csd1